MDVFGHITVQVERDLYESNFEKPLTVSKIENLFDPQKQPVKQQIATIDKDRKVHTMVNYKNKKLLLIGGWSQGLLGGKNYHNSVYQLSLETHKVSELPSMNKGRSCAASCVHNGRVYVAGGLVAGG